MVELLLEHLPLLGTVDEVSVFAWDHFQKFRSIPLETEPRIRSASE